MAQRWLDQAPRFCYRVSDAKPTHPKLPLAFAEAVKQMHPCVWLLLTGVVAGGLSWALPWGLTLVSVTVACVWQKERCEVSLTGVDFLVGALDG